MISTAPLPLTMRVFERGWLSSNNILLHGSDGEGATLIDSGYVSHAEQTLALVRHALRPGQTLARIVNTHLHSDHCGGNALLKGSRRIDPDSCRVTLRRFGPGMTRF
jgi:glyoxylase-like metal-dependent hydrolase (beta-lactamase superfamily II)